MKLKELIKDVENVELTPEQEKQIKNYLGIKESKRWQPIHNEDYYYIYCDLTTSLTTYSDSWPSDTGRAEIYNCFKTKEEAEFAAEKIRVYLELKNFADENNGPIDWRDGRSAKHIITYCNVEKRVCIDCWSTTQFMGCVYFSSEKLAWEAIKTVGEDRIKKYLFGVE